MIKMLSGTEQQGVAIWGLRGCPSTVIPPGHAGGRFRSCQAGNDGEDDVGSEVAEIHGKNDASANSNCNKLEGNHLQSPQSI